MWRNWSGSVECRPSAVLYPESEAALQQIVRENAAAGRSIRVVGSGHSFTPLVATHQILISLDRYQGLDHVDAEQCRVTVRGGTKIKALNALLFEHGLSMENLGDIDVQSIAGAISTGTHGTGAGLGSIATQVVGLTLVTTDGDLLECSESHNPEIFKAAQVSLGTLGVISKVTLRVLPAYRLKYTWQKMSLDTCLTYLEQFKAENRHFEFYWIPYTRTVLAKFMNHTDELVQPKNAFRRLNELVLENGVFWGLSEICRLLPASTVAVAQAMSGLISDGQDIQYANHIFATPRLVRFQEMEYALPTENFAEALHAVDLAIRQNRFDVHFPLECRFVKGDDIYLSSAYGRHTAYIAAHMYKGIAYRAYFDALEAIFRRFEGRPHWGKMHTRHAEDFPALYPRWTEFQTIRQQLDPGGVFLNDYLRALWNKA